MSVCRCRYRKLLEAAKDVDDFTRYVIAKYAELRCQLRLQQHEDIDDVDCDDVVDDVEPAVTSQLLCNTRQLSSRSDLMLTYDCQRRQHVDDLLCCTGHGISPSYQHQPTVDGSSLSSSFIISRFLHHALAPQCLLPAEATAVLFSASSLRFSLSTP